MQPLHTRLATPPKCAPPPSPELSMPLKPSSWLGWLVPPGWLSPIVGGAFVFSRESVPCPGPARGVPTARSPQALAWHPREPGWGCRAGLGGGCCAGPAPLPALISCWKSQSLLQIQLWFWGQPSPSPSFLFPPSALLPPPLPPSSPHCALRGLWVPLQHRQPPPCGRLGRGAEGEGCGGQAE